jgi:hypothetical protein
VREGTVDQVGEHGLDDGVPSVREISLHGGFVVVGEERVVPPDREQLLDSGLVTDPAHDQSGGHWMGGGGERGEGDFGDLRIGNQLPGVGIDHRARVARAVFTASLTIEAAPLPEPAFPARSRIPATTGPPPPSPGRVEIVVANGERPLRSTCLPAILVCPKLAPCLACP